MNAVSKVIDVPARAKIVFSCQLVYSQVSDWISGDVIHDSHSNYSLKQTRFCVNGTIGKPRGCAGPKERLFTYLWIRQNMTFLEARENCHNMSGKLFDYLDGQISTIEFFLIHMLPTHAFWIGIERVTGWGANLWVTEEKQRMSGHWMPLSADSPNSDEDKYLSIDYVFDPDTKTPMNVFFRRNENETLPSVCYSIKNLSDF